jgi:hypothetical protein
MKLQTLLLLGGCAFAWMACDVADEPLSGPSHSATSAPQPGATPGGSIPPDRAGDPPPGTVGSSSPPGTTPGGSDGGATGNDGGSSTVPESGTTPPKPTTMIASPSQAIVTKAIAAGLSSYHRNASTGDIWCLPCDGAPIILAAAAYAGNTSVDTRLLQQIREVIASGKDPFVTGGYAANDERNVTAMFAIVKKTPRIWSQLTTGEVAKIDMIMKASLVSDAWLTADKTNASGVPVGFDGDTNHDRGWNPNYREGMIGAVLVATEYFGGQTAAEAILESYSHTAFTSEIQASGLTNLYWTYGTLTRSPGSGAPTAAAVEAGIKGFQLYGKNLGQLLDVYVNLAEDTFSATVACGLNGGAGINGAGKIVAGCSALPNVGSVGMEKEFDSVDAEGQRSSAGYVRLGLRTHLFNHLVLYIYGDWKDTTASTAALQHVKVGVTDFFYKAHQGYEGYSHASDEGLFNCANDMDCDLNESIWTELLAPAHGL